MFEISSPIRSRPEAITAYHEAIPEETDTGMLQKSMLLFGSCSTKTPRSDPGYLAKRRIWRFRR
jgi:hypothetical protein